MKYKLRELYVKVRKNPKKANEVIQEAKKIEKELLIENNSRALSFITLKNDLILQENLTEENVDSYLEDLRYCIDKKLYLAKDSYGETPFKIFQMIAKIQYAYNLLESNKSIRNLYEDFLEEYNKNFSYYFRYFRNKNIEYNNYQFIFIYSIYYLFIDEYYDESISKIKKITMDRIAKIDLFYRNILSDMMGLLREHKRSFQIFSLRQFKKENLTRYDFIY